MSKLEDFIRYMSPIYAAKRERARVALRMYDAAEPGRRTSTFRGRGTAVNTEIQRALVPLRDRSRDFARNSTWGPRGLDILTAYTIGNGWRPMPRTGSDRADAKVVKIWEEWNAEADARGFSSFDGIQALAFRSMVESGDVLLRFLIEKRNKKGQRTSKVPFKIQLLEADLIDQSRDGAYAEIQTGTTYDTKTSRLGVGLGEYDRFTGLWLYDRHPGDNVTATMTNYMSRFYEMDDLAFMFKELRPGQVRGVPWFASILMTGRDLADLLDALVVKAKTEASFCAFVTNANAMDYESPFDESQQVNVSRDNPDAMMTTLEPGMIKELPMGRDIKFAQPTSAGQVDPMLKHPLMAMAAGLGITYEQFSGDLSGSNYISLRAGKIDFRKLIEQVQYTTVEQHLMRRTWKFFVDMAIMSGELADRKGGYACDWVTPAWESVNPKFDQDAEQKNVRAGRVSPQEFIETNGRDWRKNQDDMEEFLKRADKKGLVYDIDPRNRTAQGQAINDPSQQPGQPGQAVPAEAPAFDDNGNEIPEDQQDQIDEQLQAANDRILPFPRARLISPPKPKAPKKPRARTKPEKRAGDFNEEDHPRDEGGKFTDGGGSEGSGGGDGGASSKASTSSPSTSSDKTTNEPSKKGDGAAADASSGAAPKEPSTPKPADFEAAGIKISGGADRVADVVSFWNENIGRDPAEFVKEFFGGVDASVKVSKSGNELFVEADLKDKSGKSIGHADRYINTSSKTATSAYFKIDSMERGRNIGKAILAGNMAMYEKLGIEEVKVHANIDVGGYAWAKYGYVPTRSSWNELRQTISDRLDGGSRSGGGGRAGDNPVSSWDEVGEMDRDQIYREWASSSRDEFLESEVQNWRDNGGELDDAKSRTAQEFNDDPAAQGWASDKVGDIVDADENFPFTSEQILSALEVSYDADGEGRNDPEFSFDDSKLTNPKGYDKDQGTLPGIEKVEPHEYLTEEMREQITDALTKSFNKHSEDRGDIDPPDHLSENVEEYQQSYWDDSLDDRGRYQQAERLGMLPNYDHSDDEDAETVDEEQPGDDRSAILKLTQSSNPKSLWAIADSPLGKRLLLNSNWNGVLDMKDADTMSRFNAYIAQKKGK